MLLELTKTSARSLGYASGSSNKDHDWVYIVFRQAA